MNEIENNPMIGTLEPIKEFEIWKLRKCMQLLEQDLVELQW
jgi:hypothetical protein